MFCSRSLGLLRSDIREPCGDLREQRFGPCVVVLVVIGKRQAVVSEPRHRVKSERVHVFFFSGLVRAV